MSKAANNKAAKEPAPPKQPEDPISAAGKLRTALLKSHRGWQTSAESAFSRHKARCAELVAGASPEAVAIVRSTHDGANLLTEAGIEIPKSQKE